MTTRRTFCTIFDGVAATLAGAVSHRTAITLARTVFNRIAVAFACTVDYRVTATLRPVFNAAIVRLSIFDGVAVPLTGAVFAARHYIRASFLRCRRHGAVTTQLHSPRNLYALPPYHRRVHHARPLHSPAIFNRVACIPAHAPRGHYIRGGLLQRAAALRSLLRLLLAPQSSQRYRRTTAPVFNRTACIAGASSGVAFSPAQYKPAIYRRRVFSALRTSPHSRSARLIRRTVFWRYRHSPRSPPLLGRYTAQSSALPPHSPRSLQPQALHRRPSSSVAVTRLHATTQPIRSPAQSSPRCRYGRLHRYRAAITPPAIFYSVTAASPAQSTIGSARPDNLLQRSPHSCWSSPPQTITFAGTSSRVAVTFACTVDYRAALFAGAVFQRYRRTHRAVHHCSAVTTPTIFYSVTAALTAQSSTARPAHSLAVFYRAAITLASVFYRIATTHRSPPLLPLHSPRQSSTALPPHSPAQSKTAAPPQIPLQSTRGASQHEPATSSI